MNRRWVWISLMTIAAGLLAFTISRNWPREAQGNSLDCLRDVSRMTRELGLSSEQARRIGELHASLAVALDEACTRHCAARARAGRVLAQGTNGQEKADAALAEMCRAYEDSERTTLYHIRKVREVLTAEQRKRFDGMVGECMCRGCRRPSPERPGDRGSCQAMSMQAK